MVCTHCGTIGWPKRYTPGSFGTELLLFLFFIIPGLIYGIWRIAARKDVCAACLSDALVPIGSPAGRAMTSRTQARMSASGSAPIAPALKRCPDCAEDVRAEARKCRFCGFIFPESADAELKPELSDTQPAPATVSVEPTEQLQTVAPAPRPFGRVTPTKVIFALIVVALTYVSVVHHTSSPPSSGGRSTSPEPRPASTTSPNATAAGIGDVVMVRPGYWVCGSTKEALDEMVKWAVRNDNDEMLRTMQRTHSFAFVPQGFQVKILDSGVATRKVRVTGWLDPDDGRIHAYPEEKRIGRECWVASEAVTRQDDIDR
jgi:hypothetical protein